MKIIIKKPTNTPLTKPMKISKRLFSSIFTVDVLFFNEPAPTSSKAIVVIIPNTVIAIISSKLDAAIKVVGIPFFVPYFLLCKIISDGTRTAGETAPRQNPLARQRDHGI